MCAKGSRPARNDTTNETIVCADLTSLPPMNMNTSEAQMKNFGEGACPEKFTCVAKVLRGICCHKRIEGR